MGNKLKKCCLSFRNLVKSENYCSVGRNAIGALRCDPRRLWDRGRVWAEILGMGWIWAGRCKCGPGSSKRLGSGGEPSWGGFREQQQHRRPGPRVSGPLIPSGRSLQALSLAAGSSVRLRGEGGGQGSCEEIADPTGAVCRWTRAEAPEERAAGGCFGGTDLGPMLVRQRVGRSALERKAGRRWGTSGKLQGLPGPVGGGGG